MMKLCSISCMTDILKVPHAKQDKGVIRKCSKHYRAQDDQLYRVYIERTPLPSY